MPNHVYASISVEKEYADKLREISKVGLCRHYHPMPKELDNSVSGSESAKPEWQKQKSKELIEKYGADNWYSWCVNNWGTKWGCYETTFTERDDGGANYHFSTAWSPVSPRIMDMLMEDIKSFEYEWEEEQGYGEYHIITDGEFTHFEEWDMPNWSSERWEEDSRSEDVETNGYSELTLLTEPITKWGKTYKRGYYLDYCFDQYFGTNYERAVEKIAKRRKELN